MDKTPPTGSHPHKPSKSASCPKLIRLPSTDIEVERLPIMANLPLARNEVPVPAPAHVAPFALFKMSSSQSKTKLTRSDSASGTTPQGGGSGGKREPKFVPYEPYKAAVKPMVIRKKSKKKQTAAATTTSPESGETAVHRVIQSADCVDGAASPASPFDASERRRLEDAVAASESQLRALKMELDEKEKQLRIQTQVNTEVKRLLVASVGEDIEAKVDFLTQDKARLAADIRQYATKISRDFEEKEQLSVESNLWKSKFLACR